MHPQKHRQAYKVKYACESKQVGEKETDIQSWSEWESMLWLIPQHTEPTWSEMFHNIQNLNEAKCDRAT